jgi:hypothetical protein
MPPSLIYRAVAVLLLVYAIAHTLGFSKVNPSWGIDAPISALKTSRFTANGTPDRTFWGFYVGFGFFCTVLLLFAAGVAWQLGSLPGDLLARLQIVSWLFAGAFVAATIVTRRYFFTAPVVFSAVITLGLIVAAALARRH